MITIVDTEKKGSSPIDRKQLRQAARAEAIKKTAKEKEKAETKEASTPPKKPSTLNNSLVVFGALVAIGSFLYVTYQTIRKQENLVTAGADINQLQI